jgi:hypothetical protein
MELIMWEYGIIYEPYYVCVCYPFQALTCIVIVPQNFLGTQGRLQVCLYSALQAIVNCKTESCNKAEVSDSFIPGCNIASLRF